MSADIATLRIRYPAFANTPDATIAYWLTDAADTVDDSWQPYADNATMALAAYNMARTGALEGGAASLPEGVTEFRSAGFNARISDSYVAAQVEGGYGANVYGREFLTYLRRRNGGPRLVGGVEQPCVGGWGGYRGW